MDNINVNKKYKNMKQLRMKRLQREVQERVLINGGNLHKSFQQVLDHLYKSHELYYDNDRIVQAMETMRDITTLKEMIQKYNEID